MTDFGGQEQEAFLRRLRGRMGRSGPPEPHPGSAVWTKDHEEQVSYEQKADMFTQALTSLGGQVKRVATRSEAFTAVRDLLEERGVDTILAGGGEWGECSRVLSDAGVHVDFWGDLHFAPGSEERAPQYVNRWQAGLTWADYAVADLGSIVIVADGAQGRSVSLLPPLHIALIAPHSLVWSRRTVLEKVAAGARDRRAPSSLTFITGPSRSADIEMDLSVGVHGPGEVIAVMIDEPEGETDGSMAGKD